MYRTWLAEHVRRAAAAVKRHGPHGWLRLVTEGWGRVAEADPRLLRQWRGSDGVLGCEARMAEREISRMQIGRCTVLFARLSHVCLISIFLPWHGYIRTTLAIVHVSACGCISGQSD
jgi:hypothetical protein